MTFDQRAQHAARGLKRAVGAAVPPPIVGAGVIAPPRRAPYFANIAQVAAALVVVVLAAGYFSAGGFFAPFFGEALTPAGTLDTTVTTHATLEAAPDKPEAPPTTEKSPPTTDKESAKPPATEAPKVYELVILSPGNGYETEQGVVLVTGEASPGLRVVVNGEVAPLGDAGHWQVEVKLAKGWNGILAKGYLGDVKVAKASIEVFHEPPVTTTTTKPKPATDYGIHIVSPADGAHVDGSTVTVKGEATPGLTVLVNGKSVEWTDSSHWKVSIPLNPGWNGIAAKGYKGDTKMAYHAIEVLNGTPQVVAITSPTDGATVLEASSVLVKGEATPGLAVLVNGMAVDWTDSSHWKVLIPLNAGWTGITAKGYQGDTKVAIHTIEVHRGEIVVVPFTVTQMYGSCSENPPYETFYGTATPNGKVWVQSPYGEKTVHADGAGNFEVTIHFEGVPSGKTFEISVKDYEKHEYQYFPFTYTG